MAGWRFLAFRINGDGTDTLLHPDVPLGDVAIEPTLSGVASFTATIGVEVPIFDMGNAAALVPWSTMIAAEYDGDIRGCWIITELDEQGPQLQLTAGGYVGYLSGMPYVGQTSFTNRDALDVAREVWGNLQAQPGSNLGLTLDGTLSGVMLGQLPVDLWPAITEGAKLVNPYPEHTEFTYTYTVTPAKPTFTKTTLVKGVKTTTTVAPAQPAVKQTLNCEATSTYPATLPAGSTIIVRDTKTTLVSRDTTGTGLAAGMQMIGVGTPAPPSDGSTTDTSTQTAADRANEAAEAAYQLNWWTTTDLQSTFDDCATQGGFDYVEQHAWNADRSAITHHLAFTAGTAGRVRDDLRFVLGENISEYPQLQVLGDGYTSEVQVLGAGQGSSMIHGSWMLSPLPRLRRVKTVLDSTITSTVAANARAQREGLIANGGISIAQLVVNEHPNAPLGSWNLGDTITLESPGQAWGGAYTLQLRVLSYEIQPDAGNATLTVATAEKASV